MQDERWMRKICIISQQVVILHEFTVQKKVSKLCQNSSECGDSTWIHRST